MVLRLSNKDARRVVIAATGLADRAGGRLTGDRLAGLIARLGYVQVDSITALVRAHHHILWSRHGGYDEALLRQLLEEERRLFEHWTHDAAIIPVEVYPHWHHRFAAYGERFRRSKRWASHGGDGATLRQVRRRVRDGGPVMARDFAGDSQRSGPWWGWSRHKAALEYLWFTGELAVAARHGFAKVYDLSQRVIPSDLHGAPASDEAAHKAWAAGSALQRLGFASAAEVARFWDAMKPADAAMWLEAAVAQRAPAVEVVEVEGADGTWREAFAPAGLAERLKDVPPPEGRLRLLNPFDPLLRDRARLERVFGFHYRIEVYVPAARRTYGYYVCPLLEGDRLVGRAEVVSDRKAGALVARAVWPEPGVRFGVDRQG
ncbi:MAG: crosslink repair DNA glycosylase YcaQ family protein, partial [Alphaproteobacteria bacterium]